MAWDSWLDPDSIECLCGRCQRGGRCRWMRDMWSEYYEENAYREQCAALTPDDVAWLESVGWSCPEPLLADRAGSVGRGVKCPPGSTTKSRRAGCVGST